MKRAYWSCLALLSLGLMLAGCSQWSDFKVAKVSGQVTCDGKPVPYVTVYFQPKQVNDKKALVGKQGVGYADENGRFVISTYDTNDGAVIGQNGVLVGPPSGESAPKVRCDCLFSSKSTEPVTEVKVEPGKDNTFVIQLKEGNKRELAAQDKAIAKEQTRNATD
jgi:hypothetical protein